MQQMQKGQRRKRKIQIVLSPDIASPWAIVRAGEYHQSGWIPERFESRFGTTLRRLTPTELPRKNRMAHKLTNELAKDARIPNTAVKKRVALNAVLRPITSEPARQMRNKTKAGAFTYMFPSPQLQASCQQTWKKKAIQCSCREL